MISIIYNAKDKGLDFFIGEIIQHGGDSLQFWVDLKQCYLDQQIVKIMHRISWEPMEYSDTIEYFIDNVTISKKDNNLFNFSLKLNRKKDTSPIELDFEDITLDNFKFAKKEDIFSKYYIEVPEKYQYSFVFMKEI